ncbi:phage SPO1 DNA polymerase-related protein [Thermobaculum terrenum ATCC BAA-798]|uniref:Type-4 uracil-DNA glycosylase n=1 Tax=Thermobaculum terrenum (strain ATCC BAA-798 / CCMEE 7001 / YNP1) TaxID=525904 RepID=D1CFK6_THET1|nr:uracil-DNA glycosylase [Thermobaculum terrenum]ACZ41712.1 phage SPO1 DNA polymerase-related protein [Thermobaculum terrenum ATCC BAA-798]
MNLEGKSREDSLELIASEVRKCTKCPLSATRTNAVPGEGNPSAQIMFIGEGPGFNEDRQGRPFVGAAGAFLNELLQSVGLRREDVFITNVVKCRPPGNRDPLPEEIQACSCYLDRQIELIKPAVIVTLGRYSMARYFPNERISRIHGQPRRIGDLTVVPLFHPAAALHQPALKETSISDFKKIPKIVEEALAARASKQGEDQDDHDNDNTESLEQLKLF